MKDKIEFTTKQSVLYSREFDLNKNKSLRIQLNNEFRKHHKSLSNIISGIRIHPDNPISELQIICKHSIEDAGSLINQLIVNTTNSIPETSAIIASLIHMFINRLFNTEQRYKEMLIYFHINKYYISENERLKYQDQNASLIS